MSFGTGPRAAAASAVLALLGCAPGRQAALSPSAAVSATIIYVVHGDGAYGYHDASGRRRLADRDALSQAEETARRARGAEVFIFHQHRPRFIGFASPGIMRQFRDGRLMREKAYAREPEFGAEASLFAKFAAHPFPEFCVPAGNSRRPPAYFLYFGHEISAAALSGGLGRFAHACRTAKPFSLIAISACRGGTPQMTRALSSFADYVLASPGDLHLSYLDTRAVARLPWTDPRRIGQAVADESFARLRATTHTQITLALYETRAASAYLETRRQAWDFEGETRRDCAENPAFGPGGAEAGALVLYRPPRFGTDKDKTKHSGWECAVEK